MEKNLHKIGIETIKVDTIAHYCEEYDIKRIDLLKIDVEGHEMDILRGAGKMLNPKCIRSIQFEFGGPHVYTRTFFKDFYELLSQLKYQIARITPSGHFEPILTYSPNLEVFRSQNFLATA